MYLHHKCFRSILTIVLVVVAHGLSVGQKRSENLRKLQQDFVNLQFGMFIHYSMATYLDHDWADPEAKPSKFTASDIDCDQWATAAKSANMKFGCFTAKHVSGFAMWDTKTTDYGTMNSPLKKDVVKEFAEAFRKRGMKVMLYYSILDTHHQLRANSITQEHIELIKAQLTELLTNYGEITAIFFDAWDAPWARISYKDIPFEEIYSLVKSLQPDCLVMDLNASKYPADALFYTDIKSYEQNAGEHISKEKNRLPAVSSYPINDRWFWKSSFPTDSVKSPADLVDNHLVPLNKAYCAFILNVAPNRQGSLDKNTTDALREIGRRWDGTRQTSPVPESDDPVTSVNLALGQTSNSSWSDDMWISDFANDDNFTTSWMSNPVVNNPWYEIVFDRYMSFNMISLIEDSVNIKNYVLEYYRDGKWNVIQTPVKRGRVKIHRFKDIWAGRVRVRFTEYATPPHVIEFGIYNENN